jgi:UDP-N-acetylglucosamine transferase subunit ALG13
MIFVTVGASGYQFDRLLEAVADLDLDEEMVVQHGPSGVRVPKATRVDFLPFESIVDHVRRARSVVTHAGIGSVLLAAANGKRPIVVPRLSRFGEAVDDHQLGAGRKLAEAGLVRLVEDPRNLAEALSASVEGVAETTHGGPLADDIRDYLQGVVGAGGAKRRRG